jgi:hypothetical protein
MTFVANFAVSMEMVRPAVSGKLNNFAATATRPAPAQFGAQRVGKNASAF